MGINIFTPELLNTSNSLSRLSAYEDGGPPYPGDGPLPSCHSCTRGLGGEARLSRTMAFCMTLAVSSMSQMLALSKICNARSYAAWPGGRQQKRWSALQFADGNRPGLLRVKRLQYIDCPRLGVPSNNLSSFQLCL